MSPGLEYALILLLPLVPTVLLYAAFQGKNFSRLIQENRLPKVGKVAIELGGPAALYGILFFSGYDIYDDFKRGDEIQRFLENQNSLQKALTGEYCWNAQYNRAKIKVTSSGGAEIFQDNTGQLLIKGFSPGGTFEAFRVVAGQERLYYDWVSEADDISPSVSGVTRLKFADTWQGNSQDKIENLEGSWSDFYENNGRVEMHRVRDQDECETDQKRMKVDDADSST